MISSETSNLIKSIAAGLAAHASPGWSEIVAYYEIFDVETGRPSSVSCAEFVLNGKVERDFISPAGVGTLVEELHSACSAEGNPWSGFCISIRAVGRYSVKFHYGSIPLADGDHVEVGKRMAAVNA